MKTFLFYPKRLVWGIAMLGAIVTTNAQQSGLKTQADQLTGKQVYHNAKKLYEGKSGTSRASKPERVVENLKARMEYERKLLEDPATGEIPRNIRQAEALFSDKIPVGDASEKSLAQAAKSSKRGRFSYWTNRGPWNVGGRTRALAIDRNNENVILAGGVSGGLWRSENGGETWRKVTRSFQNPSITAIVQDPRPGKSFTWYYASGERLGNSASEGGAFYQGTGIYRSRDGGRTWENLRNTNDGDPRAFGPLDLINSIVINPINGDIYVGTITGVHRSQDGGRNFTEVLAGGFDTLAEVAIASNGQIYATLDSNSDPNNGYFTSADGDTWTEITPDFLPEAYGRSVMGIDPSNPNVVYFLTVNGGAGGPVFLHRYDAAAEENWTDLTANVPTTIGGPVGNFNPQGGYNLLVKVSPADSNLVIIGGTNLYRSTDGFTTPVGRESWIAGYSTLNDISLYPGQHPDQHALVFYPSNPNRVLSGHDGGVSVTEDITTNLDPTVPVEWTSLSNGYLTTQPYHVSFDPEPNSDDLLAGFQDNSTWYTNSTDPRADWEDLFGGDGAFSAIADGGLTRYVSSQRGRVFRFNYNEAGEFVSFTRVNAASATGFAFIAPFILDPNNDNIMYMPAGNRIWRNNDLDGIPLFSNASTDVNWVNVETSASSPGTSITALGVSTYPVANRLYYGTNNGEVYRMDNANIDNQPAINIAEGKGLPVGNVSHINVDPSNADRVIVTFSNYRIPSLFITEDGGETWTDISGNLEENADGSGNGPSARSTAFLGGSQGFFGSRLQRVFVGTSTGLYSTYRLNGSNTVWRKENVRIGNNVIPWVETRKDGFIAAAAHGNGLFSARFPVFNQLPESSLSVAYLLEDVTTDINDIQDFEVNVEGLFVSSNGSPINITLDNTNPAVATASLEGDVLSVTFADGVNIGDETSIFLVATSGEEQVAEGFTIRISELPIYNQNAGAVSSTPSQNFLDFGALVQAADDFVVPNGDTWVINRILAFGGANNAPALNNASVVIYENNNGIPGDEVYNSGQLTPISDPNDTNMNLLLPEPVNLESGTYWISVYANLAFGGAQQQWFWSSQNGGIGAETHFQDAGDLFGTGSVDWTPVTTAFGRGPFDQVFDIYGIISNGGDETGAEATPLASLTPDSSMSVSPNPSNGRFMFNLNSEGNLKSNSQERISIAVYNVTGNLVYQRSGLGSQFEWDATAFTDGFYIVKVSGGVHGIFKVLKQ
ncbi:T9SS type A sorting domain-containing protein [Aquimarina sp. D1M17]|uniref:T9SS type A sorting domain-containing protein n=1 Tax=Aquimarina acroporae TaxID=2937283 RepID=UPI0020C139A6|nr:T9SS type A sorting domain-containing protein [Aquimarina acroporae]MCK8523259.1 T9SS type A sorting domain-containing protein [Aquimarina acroporae]